MANISEDMAQQSAELLLRALGAFGQLGVDTARLVFDVGVDGASTLSRLLEHLEKCGPEYDLKTQMAISKLREACEKENAAALLVTVKNQDVPEVEKWLKKQGALYVAACPKREKGTAEEQLDIASKGKYDQTTFFYMAKDEKKVENAVAICAYKNKLINVLPPEAFFLLYDNKKDIAIVDGLDYNELCVFRELAKNAGFSYTEMENGPDNPEGSVPGTYKVVCGKEHDGKLRAIMRMVSWSLSGKDAPSIKEKVKERSTLAAELKKLISEGVKDGSQIFIDETGKSVAVENAKYIVNTLMPHQFVKVTPKGFYRYKGGDAEEFISKHDPEYEELLEEALSEFSLVDSVILDALEWEKEGLGKLNLRKNKVLEKLSVFPPEHSLEQEEMNIRKAQKKRLEKPGALEETAWLFHKYDPDKAEMLSEVVEEHYYDPSSPLEETVSIQFNAAVEHSEKYRYYDVENDERSVDNIILSATERSLGHKDYGVERDKDAER